MIYVFDTSSIRSLQHFYPTVFKTIWEGVDLLVQKKLLISTKEVWNELENQNISPDLWAWVKQNKSIFTSPKVEELQFVASIFQIPHFQGLIGERQRLKGTPVADPFVIACAKIHEGTVVTEERIVPNGAKIPNVCERFKIPCINLELFMQRQRWTF